MEEQRERLLEVFGQALHEHLWYSNQRGRSIAEKIGLTVVQVAVLLALRERNEECSMHELSQLTHQSGAVLTGVVDRLLKQELVARHPDPLDRRVVIVTLLPEGAARLAALEALRKSMFEEDLQTFTSTELQQLTDLLQKFTAGIQRAMYHAHPSPSSLSPCSLPWSEKEATADESHNGIYKE